MGRKVPTIKDFEGMNIINSIMYCKETLKREANREKRELLQQRLDELKIELDNYKIRKE